MPQNNTDKLKNQWAERKLRARIILEELEFNNSTVTWGMLKIESLKYNFLETVQSLLLKIVSFRELKGESPDDALAKRIRIVVFSELYMIKTGALVFWVGVKYSFLMTA